MSEVRPRDDIDSHYKWDLESIYPDDDAWEADVETARELIDELAAKEGELGSSGDALLEVLQLHEEVHRIAETIFAYARMRKDEDTRKDAYQAMESRARSLYAEANSASSFIEPELQALDEETIDAWLAEVDGLEIYDHYIDDVLRGQEHTRSTEVEQLLADLSDVLGAPSQIYTMFHNADLAFPEVEDADGESVEITNSNFTTLLKRPDRSFRKRVYETYYNEWQAYRNTVATAYENVLKREDKLADARAFEDARQKALFGPNVPTTVYDNLVGAVTDNLDVVHRHVELKERALDLDAVRMWDLYAPLPSADEPEISYETATEHVVDALGLLGSEYQDRVEEGIESRWIDVYENRGKRGGAYSGGTYDTQPFILMNYQDDLASMYTLAHELGHSLHSEYTSEEQPYVYSDYPIFLAEIASTVNEVLLTHHLLETIDDTAFRQHVLDQALERFRSVLYRQTMFTDFEQRAHALVADGEAVTADRLDDLFRERKAAFYEPAELDEHIDREWMRIPHFYRPFYVFQYSTGISAAVAIAADIIEEGAPAAQRYREFLALGSSDYPLELLETAGVDLREVDPIESAIDVYDRRLDEFEATLA